MASSHVKDLLTTTLVDPEMFSEATRSLLLATTFSDASDPAIVKLSKPTLIQVNSELLLNYLRKTANVFKNIKLREFFANPDELRCQKQVTEMLKSRNISTLRQVFVILMQDLWHSRNLPVLIIKHFPQLQNLQLTKPDLLDNVLREEDALVDLPTLGQELLSFLRLRRMTQAQLKKKNLRILRRRLIERPSVATHGPKMATLFEQFQLKCVLDEFQAPPVSFETVLKHVYAMADQEFFPFVQQIYVQFMSTPKRIPHSVQNDIVKIYRMMQTGKLRTAPQVRMTVPKLLSAEQRHVLKSSLLAKPMKPQQKQQREAAVAARKAAIVAASAAAAATALKTAVEQQRRNREEKKGIMHLALETCAMDRPAPVFENHCNSCYFHIAFQMLYRMPVYVSQVRTVIQEAKEVKGNALSLQQNNVVLYAILLLCFMGQRKYPITSDTRIPGALQLRDNKLQEMYFKDVYKEIAQVVFVGDLYTVQQDSADTLRRLMDWFNTRAGPQAANYVDTLTTATTYATQWLHKGLIYKITKGDGVGFQVTTHPIPFKAVESYQTKWQRLAPNISALRYNPTSKKFKFSSDATKILNDAKRPVDLIVNVGDPNFFPLAIAQKQTQVDHNGHYYELSPLKLVYVRAGIQYVIGDEKQIKQAGQLWEKHVWFPDSSMFVYCPKKDQIYYRLERKEELSLKFGLKNGSRNAFPPRNAGPCYPVTSDVTQLVLDSNAAKQAIGDVKATLTKEAVTTIIQLQVPPGDSKTPINTNHLLTFWQNGDLLSFNELAQPLEKQNPFKRLQLTTARQYYISKYITIQLMVFNDQGKKLTGRQWVIDDAPVDFGFDFQKKDNKDKGSKCKIELVGVSIHQGATLNGGHYVGYVKAKADKTWYYYDDATETKRAENPGAYTGSGIPAVLIYEKL